MKKANVVNEDISSTQKQVDAAVAALQAAIGNLIPTTQVNPTILHETLRIIHASGFYEDATTYTPNTWAPFDAARTAGQALLDGLFDENGNALGEFKLVNLPTERMLEEIKSKLQYDEIAVFENDMKMLALVSEKGDDAEEVREWVQQKLQQAS